MNENKVILDDRHEVFNLYKSQCANCVHYKDDYSCPAFPEGIPFDILDGSKTHDLKRSGQIGNLTFTERIS